MSTARAIGPITVSSSSRPWAVVAGIQRVVQARDQRAVHVQRDLVDLAQRTRAPRARPWGAEHRQHQWQTVGAHQKAAVHALG